MKIIEFLLSHKLLSLCMASINNVSGVHMSVLSEFTNFKCDFATWKGSLKCCDKCLWITHWLHYCLISLNLWSLGEIPFWWSCQCAQVLFVAESQVSACALILCTIPGCQRKGRVWVHAHVQCCQLSGWMCCAPAEMASWSVWWCCEVEGQLF